MTRFGRSVPDAAVIERAAVQHLEGEGRSRDHVTVEQHWNVAQSGGDDGGGDRHQLGTAEKRRLASLGITVAREMKRYGVTCNTINPRARTRMTVNTFGADQLTAKDGEFDVNDPDNVSPWIAYLCSDHAADITGQTFVVGGDTVALMQGLTRANRFLKGKDRWTPAELVQARAELFGDRPTGPPRFG